MEHLFHFTKDGDTEIDLEWSGVLIMKIIIMQQKFKRSGRD